MINKIRILGLLTLVFLSTGCASIMKGGDQVINVNTSGCEGSGAIICTVMNSDGSSMLTAPASVSVEKARGPLTIDCNSSDKSASGNVIVDSKYEAMSAGNLLFGGLIVIGVDAVNGAMWKYPSAIIVDLFCEKPVGGLEPLT